MYTSDYTHTDVYTSDLVALIHYVTEGDGFISRTTEARKNGRRFLLATGKESSGVIAKAVLFLNKGSMGIYSDPFREGPLLSVLS